jgi:hypothetical protein
MGQYFVGTSSIFLAVTGRDNHPAIREFMAVQFTGLDYVGKYFLQVRAGLIAVIEAQDTDGLMVLRIPVRDGVFKNAILG